MGNPSLPHPSPTNKIQFLGFGGYLQCLKLFEQSTCVLLLEQSTCVLSRAENLRWAAYKKIELRRTLQSTEPGCSVRTGHPRDLK